MSESVLQEHVETEDESTLVCLVVESTPKELTRRQGDTVRHDLWVLEAGPVRRPTVGKRALISPAVPLALPDISDFVTLELNRTQPADWSQKEMSSFVWVRSMRSTCVILWNTSFVGW